MGKIDDIYAEIELEFDRKLEFEQTNILRAIKQLEDELLRKAASLKSVTDISKAGAGVKTKLDYIKDLNKAVAETYGKSYEALMSRMSDIEFLIQEEYKAIGLGLRYTAADKDIFKNSRIALNSEFSNFGDHIATQAASPFMDALIVGTDFATLSSALEKILFNNGVGMAAAAGSRLAHDSLMSYYSTNHIVAAKRNKIEHFLYYGNIIGSTRPFCRERAGKVYPLATILTWNELIWKGKKPGNVLLNRGGYRCRHTFHPVRPRWVKNGEIEVQKYVAPKKERKQIVPKEEPKVVVLQEDSTTTAAVIAATAEKAVQKAYQTYNGIVLDSPQAYSEALLQAEIIGEKKLRQELKDYEDKIADLMKKVKAEKLSEKEEEELYYQISELKNKRTIRQYETYIIEKEETDKILISNAKRNVDYTVSANSEAAAKKASKGLEIIIEYLDIDLARSKIEIEVSEKIDRAFYDLVTEKIYLSPSDSMEVAAHEFGHAFELVLRRDSLEKATDFLRKRTKGSKPIHLGPGYADNEIYLEGGFPHKYCGKLYEKEGTIYATELISMGFQYLAEDPIEFVKKDKEYFEFIISLIKGFGI